MTFRLIFSWFFFLLCAPALRAEVRLPDVLADHMVLQRQQRVPIWGTALPGEEVTVRFGDQHHQVSADTEGKWIVHLSPLAASAVARDLTILGTNSITLTDILVGEVWLCTGQSNMQWRLLESDGGTEAIAAADYPEIRLFNVSREVGFHREEGKLAEWQACTPETIPSFSGIGYFFGLDLYQRLGIPVGLINSSYGGSQAEAWTPREYLAAEEELIACIQREEVWAAERPAVQAKFDRDVAEWKAAAVLAEQTGETAPRAPRSPDALRDYRIAGSIYQNMIEPLIPFAIRGAVWYQGESNEERAEQYELLLTTMIRSWREYWMQGNFPFGIIQLPNFRQVSDQPEDLAWSHLRDRQRRVASQVANTGLIVTIDVGEADDIHPTNKYDVGKRTARWALSDVYGEKGPPGGPVFSRAQFTSGKVTLHFDGVGEGLRTTDGGDLHEFAVAGEDRQWTWATGKIVGRNIIVVEAEGVSDPRAVRYAFNNNPLLPTLTNGTGVPATPFRTDDWPGPTHGKR